MTNGYKPELDKLAYETINEYMKLNADELYEEYIRADGGAMDCLRTLLESNDTEVIESNRAFGLEYNVIRSIANQMYHVWLELGFEKNVGRNNLNPPAIGVFKDGSNVERANLYAMTVGDTGFLERVYNWLNIVSTKIMGE